MADFAPDFSPYRFGFDNPVLFEDQLGLFETRKEAKEHRREENLKGRVVKEKDGTFSIENRYSSTFKDAASGEVITSVLVKEGKQSNSVSGNIMAGTLIAAGVTSQLDTPLPGPADVVALGEIAVGGILAGLTYVTVDQYIARAKDDDEDRMKGGKKKSRDRDFGIKDRKFWDWWHKQKGKMKGKGREKDIKSREEAEELYESWKSDGSPKN